MRNAIYIIMLLLACSATAFAQKKVTHAIVVEKQDGTKDTIRLYKGKYEFRGLDNPKDGDYVECKVSGNLVINGYYNNVTLETVEKNMPYNVEDYGCIITSYPIDENGRDSIMDKIPTLRINTEDKILLQGNAIFISNDIPQIYLNNRNVNFNYYDSRYKVNNLQAMELPEDGKEYQCFAYLVSDGKRYYSKLYQVKGFALMDKMAAIDGYPYFDRHAGNGYAFNCDVEATMSKYQDVFKAEGKATSQKAISEYLSNLSIDESLFMASASRTRECTDGTLYYLDKLPEQTEKDMVAAISNCFAEKYPLIEAIKTMENGDSLRKYLEQYETVLVSDASSQYDADMNKYGKVVLKRYVNTMAFGADITRPDASYTMLLPDNEAWKDMYEKAMPYYNYLDTYKYMDVKNNTTAIASLKNNNSNVTYTREDTQDLYDISRIMMNSCVVFDNHIDANKALITGNAADSNAMMTMGNNTITNVAEVLAASGKLTQAGNSYVRTMTKAPFKPAETYSPVMKFNEPCRVLGLSTRETYTKNYIAKQDFEGDWDDMMSELPDVIKQKMMADDPQGISWVSADSLKFSSLAVKPEMDFALHGVRSGKYKVYVVTMPIHNLDEGKQVMATKPLYVRFDMAYTDANGNPALQRINELGAKSTADIVIPADGKMQVVEMEFEFPVCYYNTWAFPTLFVSHTKSFATSSNRNRYEQELRIAGVYLVPAE